MGRMDIAAILDKVSKKGSSSSKSEMPEDEGDEDPSTVAAESQVEKFFTKGKAGDFGAATSALRAAIKLCGGMSSDDKDDEE